MKPFTIIIGAKVPITFSAGSVFFIRGVQATKTVTINYSGGTGQSLTAGQVLFTTGVANQLGYISIISTQSYILSGSGSIVLSVTAYPVSTTPNGPITFNIDSSPVTINATYNSLPTTEDITLNTPNRTEKVITTAEILEKVTDYDSDTISEFALVGDVTGYKYDNTPYVSDTFISMIDISAGKFKYTPLDQDALYSKTVQYKVKDSNGNISI